MDAGRWDLATALAQVAPLARRRTRSGAADRVGDRRPALEARPRLRHSRADEATTGGPRPGCARDAAARAVPVAARHADPGVGGGQRRGGDRQARSDAERVRHGQRGAPSRRPRGTADAARGTARAGGRSPLARAGAGVARHHALASRLARRALAGSLRLRGDRSVGPLRQHARRGDDVAAGRGSRIGNRDRGSGIGTGDRRSAIRDSATSRARRRDSYPAGSCWRAGAMRCRTCGLVPRMRRTKRPRRSAWWRAPSGAAAYWTPVRRPAARAWRCGRGCRPTPDYSPTTSASVASRCWPQRLPACPARAFRSCGATRRTCHLTGSLDTLLIDAPCSGLGTLRRDPDVRWRRTAADLATLRRHAAGDDRRRAARARAQAAASSTPPVPASQRRTRTWSRTCCRRGLTCSGSTFARSACRRRWRRC